MDFSHSFTDQSGTFHNMNACGFHRFYLLSRSSMSTRDYCTSMPHPSAGGSCTTCDETNHRFQKLSLDVRGRFLLGSPSDFPDEYYGLRFLISIEKLEYIDELCPDYGVSTDTDARGLTQAPLR
jgi:hypothetical protein